MIHEPTPKFRSESNDSRIRSKVLIWIKWFAIRDPIGALPNSESFCATMVQLIRSVKNLCFTNHYVLYKIITSNVEIGKWMALLIWFWIVNRLNWTIEVTSVILPVGLWPPDDVLSDEFVTTQSHERMDRSRMDKKHSRERRGRGRGRGGRRGEERRGEERRERREEKRREEKRREEKRREEKRRRKEEKEEKRREEKRMYLLIIR